MAPSMRARVAVIHVLLFPALVAASGESVTESDAIRLFLEESPQARRVPAIVRSVDAASRVETPVANPEVTYQVEDAAGVDPGDAAAARAERGDVQRRHCDLDLA